MVLNIIPLGNEPIDYGGDPYPYGAENISEWLTLAEDGASEYRIVVPAAATAAETEGAQQLRDYFSRISGVILPIESDSAAAIPYEIRIGNTNRADLSEGLADVGPEGFLKKADGDAVYLAGIDERGIFYSVSSFLEEQLGVRWFTPELTVAPSSGSVRIDALLDDVQNPVFEYRDDYWSVVFGSAEWKAHHKVNSHNGSYLGGKYGGGISYADFCHSFDRLLPNSLFDTRPELFSYRIDKGERTKDQRCLTNPDTLGIMAENARLTLLAHPDSQIMSITQNDNQEYCQCDICEAEAARLGGQSGLMVWFTNQVARALGAEFPDVIFDTFAYQYTRPAPTVLLPGENTADPNVCVRLCSIECCFAHPLERCGHIRGESLDKFVNEIPSSFAVDIKNWQDFCGRLYIWDYTTNFLMYLLPFPNFQVLGPNLRFFAENQVKGVFEQGNYTGGKSGEFGEMRAYILAKLLWDPNADVEYHMADFMKAYYGAEAAPYIKEYLDIITRKTVATSHLFIFNWHDQNTFLRAWDTRPMDKLWDKAEKSAESDRQLDNIRRSRLQLRFYKCCMLVDEFNPLVNRNRINENKKLYNDIIELGVTRLQEWAPIYELDGLDWLMTATEWRDPSGLFWNSGKENTPIH